MPHRCGAVTARTALVATAASAALPPTRRIATPALDARWSTLATSAWGASTEGSIIGADLSPSGGQPPDIAAAAEAGAGAGAV